MEVFLSEEKTTYPPNNPPTPISRPKVIGRHSDDLGPDNRRVKINHRLMFKGTKPTYLAIS
ncbi:hypothetical protein CMK13_13515 [Candidatus Poribacteria bacterium]|nr:hypothetical protein [Candidatus Poribacteria bacterium]MBF74706.1 hypothetical protein [Candidatus Poribacteria bacterium]OUT58498.1 MAG: hypothetical protein CBB75_12975 [bacterium TMED15]